MTTKGITPEEVIKKLDEEDFPAKFSSKSGSTPIKTPYEGSASDSEIEDSDETIIDSKSDDTPYEDSASASEIEDSDATIINSESEDEEDFSPALKGKRGMLPKKTEKSSKSKAAKTGSTPIKTPYEDSASDSEIEDSDATIIDYKSDDEEDFSLVFEEKSDMLTKKDEKSSKSKAAKTRSTGLCPTIGRIGLKTVELILGIGAIGAALEGRTLTQPTATGIVPYTGSYDFSNNNMYCSPKDLNVPSPWNNRDSSFIAYPTFSYNLSDVPVSGFHQQYLLFSQSTPSSQALVPFSNIPQVIKPPVCPVQEFSRDLVVKTDTSFSPVSNPVAQEENNALQNIVEQNGEDYDLTGTIFAQEAEEQPENISQPDMLKESEEAVITKDKDLPLSSSAEDCKALVLVNPTDISTRLAYNESLQSPKTPDEHAEKADNMLQTTLLEMCTPDNSLLNFDADDINDHSKSLGACADYLDYTFGSQRLTGSSTKENLIAIGAQAKKDAEKAQGHIYNDYQKQAQCYYVAQHAYTLAEEKEEARKCAHECQKASAPGRFFAGNPELNALSKKNETLYLSENQSL